VPQTANWDLLGGVNFRKGCYTGQEIIARMQYLGRIKERLFAFHVDARDVAPATRLYSAAFGEQACGTVVDAAPDPVGGTALLAVAQLAAAGADDLMLGAPGGPRLARRPLPYDVPDAPIVTP
jgi:tRNA-modifying protein YgfZ